MVVLKWKDREVEIDDAVFPEWLKGLEQLDALITDEAREDLFSGATLRNIRDKFGRGETVIELTDGERDLILTLINMRGGGRHE